MSALLQFVEVNEFGEALLGPSARGPEDLREKSNNPPARAPAPTGYCESSPSTNVPTKRPRRAASTSLRCRAARRGSARFPGDRYNRSTTRIFPGSTPSGRQASRSVRTRASEAGCSAVWSSRSPSPGNTACPRARTSPSRSGCSKSRDRAEQSACSDGCRCSERGPAFQCTSSPSRPNRRPAPRIAYSRDAASVATTRARCAARSNPCGWACPRSRSREEKDTPREKRPRRFRRARRDS